MFGENPIDTLSVSKFAIWNSSNKLISNADMVSSQPLRILADESTEILEAQIVSEVEPANEFKISKKTSKEVWVDFDFVEKREGIVVQVLHTGSTNSLQLDCKIKGGGAIKHYSHPPKKPISAKQKNLYRRVIAFLYALESILVAALALALTISYIVIIASGTVLFSPTDTSLLLMFIFILWVCAIMLIIMTVKMLKRTFLIGIPATLKTYASSTYDN